jgi:hypothetical protein
MKNIYKLLDKNTNNKSTDNDILHLLNKNNINYTIHTLREVSSDTLHYTVFRTIIHLEDINKYLAVQFLDNKRKLIKKKTNIFFYEVIRKETPHKNLYIIKC